MEEQKQSTDDAGAVNAPRILLVVEDNGQVSKMLKNLLGQEFDVVLVADSPAVAELLLGDHTVTHLLCDRELGPGLPYGEALIREWRERYPSIRRALLVTGTAVAPCRLLDGIDCVLPKPVKIVRIVAELQR
ncbi:MAG: response regulator [Proteobacteria bacterium]|nr:response regulator [Pseudomonadota bacterium]